MRWMFRLSAHRLTRMGEELAYVDRRNAVAQFLASA